MIYLYSLSLYMSLINIVIEGIKGEIMSNTDFMDIFWSFIAFLIGLPFAGILYALGSNSYYDPNRHILGSTQSFYTLGGWVMIVISFIIMSALAGAFFGTIYNYISDKDDVMVGIGMGIVSFIALFIWNLYGFSYMWLLNVLFILIVIFVCLVIFILLKNGNEYENEVLACEEAFKNAKGNKISKIDYDLKVRKAAAKKISDESILKQIARYDFDPKVRRVASEKIAQKYSLRDINNVSDELILLCLVRSSSDVDVRLNALDKISDESILAEIATDNDDIICNDGDVRLNALDKINDKNILIDVRNNAYSNLIREEAQNRFEKIAD